MDVRTPGIHGPPLDLGGKNPGTEMAPPPSRGRILSRGE
jgi:hypothetical protein